MDNNTFELASAAFDRGLKLGNRTGCIAGFIGGVMVTIVICLLAMGV